MRLYLAVAVLLLAFVAYTEAQDQTMEEKMTNVRNQLTEFGQQVSDSARATLEAIKNHEATAKIKSWADEMAERVKNAFSGSSD